MNPMYFDLRLAAVHVKRRIVCRDSGGYTSISSGSNGIGFICLNFESRGQKSPNFCFFKVKIHRRRIAILMNPTHLTSGNKNTLNKEF